MKKLILFTDGERVFLKKNLETDRMELDFVTETVNLKMIYEKIEAGRKIPIFVKKTVVKNVLGEKFMLWKVNMDKKYLEQMKNGDLIIISDMKQTSLKEKIDWKSLFLIQKAFPLFGFQEIIKLSEDSLEKEFQKFYLKFSESIEEYKKDKTNKKLKTIITKNLHTSILHSVSLKEKPIIKIVNTIKETDKKLQKHLLNEIVHFLGFTGYSEIISKTL